MKMLTPDTEMEQEDRTSGMTESPIKYDADESPCKRHPESVPARRTFQSQSGNQSPSSGAVLDNVSDHSASNQKRPSAVRWADEVDTFPIERLDCLEIELLFYSQTDFATFRHEAFCEECGLDPNEY